MTVSATNNNSAAYQYLQSLLQTGQPGSGGSNSASATNGGDPITTLLNAFYPNGNSDQSGASSTSGTATGALPPMTCAGGPNFSSDTMSSLISTQEQGSSQSLFSQLDADGDGTVSQKELENAFGPNADTSKVDGLFNALDSNGDGSITQDEFASAVNGSQSQHRAHHAHHGHGSGGGSKLDALLSGADATGATTQTITAADGAMTTTISYADGSSISSTTPAAGSDSSGQNSDAGNKSSAANAIDQLMKLQSQLFSAAVSVGATLATI